MSKLPNKEDLLEQAYGSDLKLWMSREEIKELVEAHLEVPKITFLELTPEMQEEARSMSKAFLKESHIYNPRLWEDWSRNE